MDQLILTRKDGTTVMLMQSGTVFITKAEQKKTLMSVDQVTVNVTSSYELNIGIGSWITVYGSIYTINEEPTVIKLSDNEYEYELVFEGSMYKLRDVAYLNCDSSKTTFPGNFSLIANMQGFCEVLINNLNRAGIGAWVLGFCPATETITESFSGENCLAVLQKLCGTEVFNLEFDIQYSASTYTLNIRTQGTTHSEVYKYGQANGLYELKRKKSTTNTLVNRLYVTGGTKNIPTGYRNYISTKLLLPSNNESYLEDAASIAAYGVKEGYKEYEDIYPHRTGTVSSIDSSNILKFTDKDIDFDLNAKDSDGDTIYLIAGTTAKVHFQSGNLAGYEFDLSAYNTSTKTFTLKTYTDDNGNIYPNDSGAYNIAVGDTYVLIDIRMPASYVTAAEAELHAKATSDFTNAKNNKVSYELTIDEIYLRSIASANDDFYQPGDSIPVVDMNLGLNKTIRLKTFARDLLNPYSFSEIELSDDVTTTTVTQQVLTSLKEIERAVSSNNLYDVAKARRGQKDFVELQNMVFDPDGYFTDKIRPLSIETGMLSVGTKAGNFVLNAKFTANYNNDTSIFHASTGTLMHLSIEEEVKTWTLAANTITGLTATAAYYLYARCSKALNVGYYILDTVARKVDEEEGWYWFPVGILNSVVDGYRDLSHTYGSSALYGRNLKAGAIVNYAGKTLIDIDKAEIYGAVTFKSSSGDEVNVSDAISDVAANVAYKVEIMSSNGEAFRNDMIATTLIAKVYKGSEDITATLSQSCFKWVRKSSNTEADTTWNQIHTTFYSNVLNITSDDVDGRAVFNCEVSI